MNLSISRASHRPSYWLIAGCTLVAAVAVAVVAVQALRPHPQSIQKLSDSALRTLAEKQPTVEVLGEVFRRSIRAGDAARAMETARTLVAKYPRDARSHNAVGIALAAEGKVAEAHKEFDAAMALNPPWIDPYLNLGHLAMQTKDFKQAQVEFDRATAVDPNSVAAWRGFGEACAEMGERDNALTAFERAVSLAPNDPITQTDLGTFHAERGQGAEGRKHLLKAVAAGYQSGKLYAGLTMAFADQPESQADLSKALDYAQTAAKLGDHSPLLLYATGLALQRLGRYREAIAIYRQAVAISPNANGAWIGLSQCFRALGNKKIAEAAAGIGERILTQRQRVGNLQRQIESNPHRMDLRQQYADLMMSNGQYLLAAGQYRYIAQHEPDNPGAWLRVAKAFDLGGKPELSREVRAYVESEIHRAGQNASSAASHRSAP